MKTETINFQAFMQKKNQVKSFKTHSPAVLGSLVLGSNIIVSDLDMLANMGYVLMGTVGGLAILMAKAENNMAKKGKHQQADRLASFGSVLFPVIVIGTGILLLVVFNPLVRFWI